ncbi:MAG: Uma2 family endonuclease [Bryobacteraceae bacterium]|nr:Uma2 family endonuclease [Bryobacteraceae bacterium]
MAAASTMISVEDYLAQETKPASEYADGVLRQKPKPTWKHGLIQKRIGQLLDHAAPTLVSASEVTVQIRPGRFLVTDVIAQRRDAIQDPYPVEPVHVCVEVLSPADRFSHALAKCEEYHAWGVVMTWILDPHERRAWLFQRQHRPQEVAAHGDLVAEGVSIPLTEVFAALD